MISVHWTEFHIKGFISQFLPDKQWESCKEVGQMSASDTINNEKYFREPLDGK